MPALAYTTTAAVRSALGVTDNEITDQMLVDRQLDMELLVDLDAWATTHADIQTAGTAAVPTAAATKTWRLLQLYSMYFCAARIADTPQAFPQMFSDGKNQYRRFSEMDWKRVQDSLRAGLDRYRTLLETDLGLPATSVTPVLASLVAPDYDPVVGDAT